MSYLIPGIALLLLLLLAGKWFVSADPRSLARILKPLLIIFGVIIVLLLVFTGKLIWVLWAMPFLVPMYMRWRHAARWAKNTSRMSSGGASGMASEVTSKHLDMRLDHDSGDMTGTVRTGMYEGAHLSDLNLEQLLDLFQEYAEQDSESARLLGAYLDRMHPDWRDQGAGPGQQDEEGFAQGSGTMSRAEAFRILGLSETADEAEIKAAHHRLIAGLHPDRGGSAYLAAKINEARDVLLKS